MAQDGAALAGRVERFAQRHLPQSLRLMVGQAQRLCIHIGWAVRCRVARKSVLGDADVVVSMTTHGSRVRRVQHALESIARGDMRPARMILWVSDEMESRPLPANLRRLQRRGLEIRFHRDDLGPHMKYYPYVVSEFTHHRPLVTVDDDARYAKHWLRGLIEAYALDRSVICTYVSLRLEFVGDDFAPWLSMPMLDNTAPDQRNAVIGFGGALYPPAFLDALRDAGEGFRGCTPKNDDIWLTYVAVTMGFPVRQVHSRPLRPAQVLGEPRLALRGFNLGRGGNDQQLARTFGPAPRHLFSSEGTFSSGGTADRQDARQSSVPSEHIEVLIVAYGDPSVLRTCLSGLDAAFPVTVVDNSALDATRQVVEGCGGRYVTAGSNLGFARAVNLGLATFDLSRVDVLLLNPDATITPEAVEMLFLRLRESPALACVAPAQYHPETSEPIPVHVGFKTPARAWAQTLGLTKLTRAQPTDFLVGSILLLRGSALIDVGGFDEGFFLYSEEADWEKRAIERGWSVLFCPDVFATHVSGGTDKDEDRFSLRSKAAIELYLRKWYGVIGWRSYQLAMVTSAISRTPFTADPAERGYLLREARRWVVAPYRSALRAGVIPEREHYVPSLARGE